MKKIILLTAFLFPVIITSAQKGKTIPGEQEPLVSVNGKADTNSKEELLIFTSIDQQPEFPGGQRELMRYLGTHLIYPSDAIDDDVQGQVLVSFTVCRDGSLCDAEIIRSVNASIDKEVLRIVKTMPNWKPGKNKGETVKVRYRLPVTFKLEAATGEETEKK